MPSDSFIRLEFFLIFSCECALFIDFYFLFVFFHFLLFLSFFFFFFSEAPCVMYEFDAAESSAQSRGVGVQWISSAPIPSAKKKNNKNLPSYLFAFFSSFFPFILHRDENWNKLSKWSARFLLTSRHVGFRSITMRTHKQKTVNHVIVLVSFLVSLGWCTRCARSSASQVIWW